MADPSTPATPANEPLDVRGIPRLDDGAFVPVDPRHVLGRAAGLTCLAVVAITVGTLAGAGVDRSSVPVAIGAAVSLVFISLAVLSVVEARRIAYQLREHDLSVRRGVITQSVETIPFARVQHVSISRGLIERTLELATLDVNSAGPDVSVPGLTVDDASALRQLIVRRAGLSGSGRVPETVRDEPEPVDPPPPST